MFQVVQEMSRSCMSYQGSKSILQRRNSLSSGTSASNANTKRHSGGGASEYSYVSSEAVAQLDDDYLPPPSHSWSDVRPCKRSCKCCCSYCFFAIILIVCISALMYMIFHRELRSVYDSYLESDQSDTYQSTSQNYVYLDENGDPFVWQNKRLPKSIWPLENNVSITIRDDDTWREVFSGSSVIKFVVREPTDLIILHFHYRHLKVDHLMCNSNLKTPQIQSTTSCVNFLDMHAFKLSKKLSQGDECVMHFVFNATTHNSYGLFYDEYQPPLGDQSDLSYSLVTHLQDTYARYVFPCLDEPLFKAKFSFVAIFAENLFDFVLFNSPMLKEETVDGWRKIYFEQTVPMPTYVVAIVFAKNYENSSIDDNPNEFRDYSVRNTFHYPKNLKQYTVTPMDIATKSMRFFEGSFAIAFPMKKCDHFPVKSLHVFGMENWGLITYSMLDLLYNSEDFGILYERAATSLVAHEMAHQWFGNLVTMNWWDNIWLNEGFATFMSHVVLEVIRPDLRSREVFYTDGKLSMALHSDSFAGSHPIHMPDKGSFDLITYWKSCGVLSMLEHAMGSKQFFAGVGKYLDTFKYSNAHVGDLWNMMTIGSNQSLGNISHLMESWINMKHIPIVTVYFDEHNIYLNQSAYCYLCPRQSPSSKPSSHSELDGKTSQHGVHGHHSPSHWSIPLTYSFPNDQAGTFRTFLLDKESAVIPLERAKPDWIKFNTNATGLYRVFYANQNALKEFADSIAWGASTRSRYTNVEDYDLHLPYMDRGNLVLDAISSAKIGLVSYKVALEFASSVLMIEESQGAVEMALDVNYGLTDVFYRLKRHGYGHLADVFIIKHLGRMYPGFDMKTWKSDTNRPDDFNAYMLKTLCFAGHEQCLQDCFSLFQKWKKSLSSGDDILKIHPYIKDTLFPTVSYHGTLEEWEFLYNRTATKRDELMLNQPWFNKDPNLIRRVFNERYFINNEIRLDGPRILTSMFLACRNNLPAAMTVWDIIKTNWKQFQTAYAGIDLFGELLVSVFSNFDSSSSLHELLYAASTLEDLNDGFYYPLSLESITFNIKWSKLYLHECIETLQKLVE
ncbi:endoplasmic reticulum aminopeptidase 1-like [Convolutriloba macropyga]|uniref:endoplasmic reticulum aminopeptidase 1-like n=1 Tax=Convolutriloba macropyga TaxID=536237 RepID=UPI003F51BB19